MLPIDPAWHGGGADSSAGVTGQHVPPARVFVGRVPELRALDAALFAARAGEPQVVMVQGEAGIGKSSLILEFLGRQRGFPVIAASGETAETLLPYGVVQQLAAGAAARSPGVLAGLGLLSDGPGPGVDPLAVGVELRALISSLQGKQTAAVVVEDLQWADLPSARALLFACRRLDAARALVILTCLPAAMSQLGEGWARFVSGDRCASALTLRGLDAGELGLLCRQLGRAELPERTVRRLADHTGGNPVLVRALLDEAQRAGLLAEHGRVRTTSSCPTWYPTKVKKTSIYLDDADVERLRRIAAEEGRSQAEVVRAALSAYEHARDVPRVFALEGSWEGDGSSVADVPEHELLAGFGG